MAVLKRPFLSLAVLAVLLVAVHAALWLTACRLLRWQASSLLDAADQHGWTVTTGDRVMGGWPFAATLVIARPVVSGGEHAIPGGVAWSADRLTARLSLLRPRTLALSPEGQQFLRLSHAPDIGFTATRIEAWVGLWSGPHGWARLEAEGVAGGIAGSRNPQDVQIASLRLSANEARAQAIAGGQTVTTIGLDVRAHGIGLPDVGRWPLGDTVTDAGATLRLIGSLPPPANTLATPGQTRAAAQAESWKNAGGRLHIDQAELRWGPLRLEGAAELGLDDALQPAGSGAVQLAGSAAALNAASSAGLIAPGVSLTAQAVLGLMPRAEGGAVRLPFLLRDRTVSVGQVPLARLGEIVW